MRRGYSRPECSEKTNSDERNFPCETRFHHICSHGLETAGFSREITLVDQGFTDDLSEYVTEVSIPVWGIK